MAHRLRAFSLRKRGRNVEALSFVQRAVCVAPSDGPALLDEARVLFDLGRFEDAASAAEDALAMGAAAALPILGDALRAAGAWAEVEDLHRASLQRDWRDRPALRGLAEALNERGRDEDAALAKALADALDGGDSLTPFMNDAARINRARATKLGVFGALLLAASVYLARSEPTIPPEGVFGVGVVLVLGAVWVAFRDVERFDLAKRDPLLLAIHAQWAAAPPTAVARAR